MSDRTPSSHGEAVPDAAAFRARRDAWRRALGADDEQRRSAIDLQVAAEAHRYTYTWDWLGVPVIKLPDDICILQELVWASRPGRIVETGVARGGSMLLNASLQRLAGIEPAVLGIDIQILEHTRTALAEHPMAVGIELVEDDSTTEAVRHRVAEFIRGSDSALLVLDSNHTHEHVYRELVQLAPALPVGSYVLVADTIIEEFPEGHFADRPWNRGNNPLSAVRQFLSENKDFELDLAWSRRGLLSELRDGILRRVG
jgi:cephalosporin hydroxylase